MEFLYKLYSNDFFGIGLFIVITILAFSFLIILFFGKRDEKARLKRSNIKNEIESQDAFNAAEVSESLNQEPLEPISLSAQESPIIEKIEEVQVDKNGLEEIKEGDIELEPTMVNNTVLNSGFSNEEEKKESSVVSREENIFSSASEEDSLTPNFLVEEELESNREEFNINSDVELQAPIIEENVPNSIFTEEKKEEKRVATPVFSSVYLSKEKEESSEAEKREEPKPIFSAKPNMDMPKQFDLPKLNKAPSSSSVLNDSLIKSLASDEKENLNNIFENMEEDSYTLRK